MIAHLKGYIKDNNSKCPEILHYLLYVLSFRDVHSPENCINWFEHFKSNCDLYKRDYNSNNSDSSLILRRVYVNIYLLYLFVAWQHK